MRRLPLALTAALLVVSGLASAEVTREAPLVEGTAYTLRDGEWKIGLLTSSYGITDQLQIDSALLIDLVVPNAGLKYRLVDSPQLAISVNGFVGGSPLLLAFKAGFYFVGAKVDASMPLGERLGLHLTGGWQHWSLSEFDTETYASLGWVTLRAGLQYVMQPRHILFFDAGTPTSWIASLERVHDFDATDFWQATAGYQYSHGIWNFRVDVGWGPSLLGRGPVGSFDVYVRF